MNKDLKEAREWELQEFWGKFVLWRKNGHCKGPEARVCLACSGNSSNEASCGVKSKEKSSKR